MAILGCGDSKGIQENLEEKSQDSCSWQKCAIVVGAMAVVVFFSLAIVTVLQATSVISLPDSMQWIILAAEGQLPQLVGLVITTVGGLTMGIVFVAVGIMKKNPDTALPSRTDSQTSPEEPEFEGGKAPYSDMEIPNRLHLRMEAGHFWYHPNLKNDAGRFDYYECESLGTVAKLSLTKIEISQRIAQTGFSRHFERLERASKLELLRRANLREGLPDPVPDALAGDEEMDCGSHCEVLENEDEDKRSFVIRDYDGTYMHTAVFDNLNDAYDYREGFLRINYKIEGWTYQNNSRLLDYF